MPKYKTLNEHYREKYGCKVYKLSLDAGFTCPNRDGTCGDKGCIFCGSSGGGEFAERFDGNILKQLEKAKERVLNKVKDGKFIAYFQAFTNTYSDIKTLERLYMQAISPDYIVGLSIATRPDCLDTQTVELLEKINKLKPVSIELGLQTTNEETARYIRRGYKTSVYFDAVKMLKTAGIEVVTHIIIGLPYEQEEDIYKTVSDTVNAGTDGVKFHLLHVLKNTDLAIEYENGKFECLTLENYAKILCNCIKLLPQNTVVHRITGDGDKKILIAPLWSADKKKVLNYLNAYLNKNL